MSILASNFNQGLGRVLPIEDLDAREVVQFYVGNTVGIDVQRGRGVLFCMVEEEEYFYQLSMVHGITGNGSELDTFYNDSI